MKFVTEMELRDLYKMEPFTTFVLEPTTKITPGARQFLVDRRVTLVQAQGSDGKKSNGNELNQLQVQENWCTLRLRRRMECIESLFLLIAELLPPGDCDLSGEVLDLGRCFRNVRNAELEQRAPDKIQFWGWSEDEINKRFHNLGENIDIGESPWRLEKGKEVALLNYLRASLREVEPVLLEAYWNEEKQACLRQDLIDTVNLMINILGMMMRKCLGGQKWRL
ncbi:cobalamin adenosyltransferase [Desulfosporosinus sp. SB140]|uniref:cobalamin adenosyltransferase n=1 Tax=Desulfosporosinus paludis TaxID=3115649 RepID=UPI00388D8B89